MKNKIFILIVFNFQLLYAQNLLKIEYETYDKIYIDDASKKMKIDLENNNSTIKFYELLFNEEHSFFKETDKINNSQGINSFNLSTITDKIYIDISKKNYRIEDELVNKKILIIDSLPKYKWIIEKETKNILGLKVRKATTQYMGYNIVAWYSLDIKSKVGPVFFNGLPGAILELNAISIMPGEKYETSFKAINFREALKQEKIKIPNKGQVMSQKEADDFVKQENMKIIQNP